MVANPPFSDKSWSTGLNPDKDEYQRFVWGTPPAKQGDYAYLLHIIRSMGSTGKGACILPHGVLFRGNAEAGIRRQLVKSGILKGIIGLPANLFYGTGIPACILVLDKENAQARRGIFMLDASKGFIKEGNKNRLREQDIHKIVDTFNRQDDSDPRYARMVPFDEIASERNEYNLNIPRYIDSTDPEDLQDIDAHLRGGIPIRDIQGEGSELAAYWQVLPGVLETLFDTTLYEEAGRPGYSQLKLPIAEVRAAILDHDEFSNFRQEVTGIFEHWCDSQLSTLKGYDKEGHPKALIRSISEVLLADFRQAPLLNAYDVYQNLMDYWAETMQDDAYLIAADGWVAETYRVLEEVKTGKKKGEMKDKGWTCDLVPKPYIVSRYFAAEQDELNALQAQLDSVSASLEEMKEEHGGDEGALKDVSTKGDAQDAYKQALVAAWNEQDKAACDSYNRLMDQANDEATRLRELADNAYLSVLKNKKGKITLKSVKDHLSASTVSQEQAKLQSYLEADKSQKAYSKEAGGLLARAEIELLKQLDQDPLPESLTDLQTTMRYLRLFDQQTDLKAQVKDVDATLDQLALDKYPTLSVDEIKTLVVEDRWIPALGADIQGELERVSRWLTGRIQQLAERYETPLPKLVEDVGALSAKVDENLKRMGAVWS